MPEFEYDIFVVRLERNNPTSNVLPAKAAPPAEHGLAHRVHRFLNQAEQGFYVRRTEAESAPRRVSAWSDTVARTASLQKTAWEGTV